MSSTPTRLTLYCYSGNEKVLSIDPNSLAIIILLHWNEIEFELVECCRKCESPSKELPAIMMNDTVYSGYRTIYRALKSKYPSSFPDSSSSISSREFLLQINQDLFTEEVNNEELFRNFTEPALLSAKARYWWNFANSRISPLQQHFFPISPSLTSQIITKSRTIDELQNIANDSLISIEVKILLFSHLVIRNSLPKKYQLNGQFSDSIAQLSDLLNEKEFKGKIMKKFDYKPVYKQDESVEDYPTEDVSVINMNAFTGLFGVILAVAVLYTVRNR